MLHCRTAAACCGPAFQKRLKHSDLPCAVHEQDMVVDDLDAEHGQGGFGPAPADQHCKLCMKQLPGCGQLVAAEVRTRLLEVLQAGWVLLIWRARIAHHGCDTDAYSALICACTPLGRSFATTARQ